MRLANRLSQQRAEWDFLKHKKQYEGEGWVFKPFEQQQTE